MAYENKASSALSVAPCSHQDGKVRYSDKDDVEPPSVCMFRNNLTAFSQYRNLLFIAYVDKVYVYTPSFPEQTVTTKPQLVIDLPRSRPGLRGYLDPSRPHAVNHLIVGDIGDEETVVVACDDGDVISYTVRSISLAIDEGAKTVFAPDPYEDQKLKHYRQSGWANLILPIADPHRTPGFRILAPWFHENVGASAWGLATHKHAMLLAVSSNTKEINIFPLGPHWLLERRAKGGMRPWNRASRSTYPPPTIIERFLVGETRRLRDLSLGGKVTLRGHLANTPNVAFCDNNLDPGGSYLASTDIDGCTIVWDIWRGTRIFETLGTAEIKFSTPLSPNPLPRARGWAVACLDPQSSRLSEGTVSTFGCPCYVNERVTLIDNSEAGRSVHNNSQWHPGFSALASVPGMLPIGTIPPALETAVQAAAATIADQDLEIEDEAEDEAEADEEMDEIDDSDDDFDEDSLDEGEEAHIMANEEASLVEPSHAFGVIPPNPLSYTVNAAEIEQFLSDGNSILEDEDSDLPDVEEMSVADHTDQQTPDAAGEELNAQLKESKDTDRFSDTTHTTAYPNLVDLPFNLLQTDERDIHLFRDIRFDADLKRRPPDSSHCQVLCHQALNQKMPPGLNYLTQMERLNMIAQIAELGVVVVGNQVGRVGILTMTRWEAEKQSGYKIECILPFCSEERKGLRPRKPLMGMAVAPVQGQEAAPPQDSPRMGVRPRRRFRLLMTYCDHTILSYEISRPNGEEDLLVV